MEHSQVETFFTSSATCFTTCLRAPELVWRGRHVDGARFVEAPSQMLEEWIWDYDTLSKFAINEAGETIPKSLVDKMTRARYFGRATGTATQIYYANCR